MHWGEENKDIEGQVKASGTILSVNTNGTGLGVYAWGLRNPFWVGWVPDGALYVMENTYDERGSRPMGNAQDNIYRIKKKRRLVRLS